MKRFFVFLLPILLILSACSSEPKYKNDLTCDEVLKNAPLFERSAYGYDRYDKDYVDFFFDGISPKDYVILYSQEQNDINEIGVFYASNEEERAEISAKVQEYISDMQISQRAFIASYAAEELPKLDGAEVRIYGNYVIYSILSQSDMQSLWDHVKSTLEK